MKRSCMTSYGLVAFMCSFSVFAQRAKMTFHAMDDMGNSLTGATVAASTVLLSTVPGIGGTDKQFEEVTGANGLAVFDIPYDFGDIHYAVIDKGTSDSYRMKIGFAECYRDNGGKVRFKKDKGEWQPWNPTIELLLRRILNPIPMCAKKLHMGTSRIPAFGEALGYDLEKGDWLPPYGIGKNADIIFRLDCVYGERLDSGILAFDATMTLTFFNEDDGLLEYPDPQPESEGSVFRLLRLAPEFGYVNQWSLRQYAKNEGMSYLRGDENLNYYFRVRTKKDDDGKIISANYGKIRNAINFGVAAKNPTLQLWYYFNPTSLDRNMEFDPKRNLFTDLGPMERVNEP